jgi:uncharacterized CHY-type Zn-finger protein
VKRSVHGVDVFGVSIDPQTRCLHWHSGPDIIAIKFKCCGQWYSCFECHAEVTDHEAGVWPSNAFNEKAILCGACGHQLTINKYLNCGSVCPACKRRFNPGCANHHHLYFETQLGITKSKSY